MTGAPATVAVLGSCISRDNFNSRFNPTYKDRFVCPLHQNQSSIIALMSPPIEADWEPLKPQMSDYDRWNVRTELDRSFLDELVALRPDLLVVDFFGDVHFGVAQLEDGRYVTDNRWKIHPTTWYRDLLAAGRLKRIHPLVDEDAYFLLWRQAFDQLIARLRRDLPDTRIVLHRGRNTDALLLPDGTRIGLREHRKIAPFRVRRGNRFWARLDNYAARQVDHVIDLRPMRAPTYDEHPWGPFFVHYVPEYYTAFLAWLTEVDDAVRGSWLTRRRARRALAQRAVSSVRP